MKGLDAPVEVYELVGSGARALPAGTPPPTRGLTRFVGRDAELEQLRQALGRAAAGHGQVVAIVGEPGVGKSRLVWEVTHSHRVHGWLVAPGRLGLVREGDALSAGDRSAQGLLRDRGPGRPAGGAGEGDGEAPDAGPRPGGQLCRRSWRCSTCRAEDTAWDGARPPTAPPAHARRAEAALAPGEPGPAAARWSSRTSTGSTRETQALLDGLVESLPAARLLLLVNYRPGVSSTTGAARRTTRSSGWTRFRRRRAEELLGALLGPDAGLAAAQAAADRADGGEPVLPGGERPGARRDRGAARASAGPTGWRGHSRPSRFPPRCRPSWPPASTGWPPRTRRSCRRHR